MIQRITNDLADLYSVDETAWLEEMVRRVEQERFDELDYSHLAEYLSDMARRDRREVSSRLIILLSHILKWTCQADRRSASWRRTIIFQQQELEDLLIGVLRSHAEESLTVLYAKSVRRAQAETGLASDVFPAMCPYTLDEILQFPVLPAE